jgi:pimeloyl-ACP methyl ester carboxylesterase
MYRQPEQVDSQVRERAAAMNIIPVRNGTWAADAQALNPLNPAAAGRLAEIHAPTLVIAGALDHPEILRAAEVMQLGIKGAEKFIIPDAAHVPNMEQPTLFNQAVLDFLKG